MSDERDKVKEILTNFRKEFMFPPDIINIVSIVNSNEKIDTERWYNQIVLPIANMMYRTYILWESKMANIKLIDIVKTLTNKSDMIEMSIEKINDLENQSKKIINDGKIDIFNSINTLCELLNEINDF
jgi:hypothetical protein